MEDINELIEAREMLASLQNHQSFMESQGIVEYWNPGPPQIHLPPNLQPRSPMDAVDDLANEDQDTNELEGEVGELDGERPDGEPFKPKYVFHERRLYDLYYKTSDSHFKSLTRMIPSTFDCLLDELEPHMISPGKASNSSLNFLL